MEYKYNLQDKVIGGIITHRVRYETLSGSWHKIYWVHPLGKWIEEKEIVKDEQASTTESKEKANS